MPEMLEASLKIDASFIEIAFMNQMALTCWRFKVDQMPRELLARTPESELLLIKKGYLDAFRDVLSNIESFSLMVQDARFYRKQVDDYMSRKEDEHAARLSTLFDLGISQR